MGFKKTFMRGWRRTFQGKSLKQQAEEEANPPPETDIKKESKVQKVIRFGNAVNKGMTVMGKVFDTSPQTVKGKQKPQGDPLSFISGPSINRKKNDEDIFRF